jgi:hypothetical protein
VNLEEARKLARCVRAAPRGTIELPDGKWEINSGGRLLAEFVLELADEVERCKQMEEALREAKRQLEGWYPDEAVAKALPHIERGLRESSNRLEN